MAAAPVKIAPMDLRKAQVCITGGSAGIGLGLARRFQDAGSTVIVTGRRAAVLESVKKQYPKMHTFQGDVGSVTERQQLATYLNENFPNLNIFVNNAGMVREVTAPNETDDWSKRQVEVAVNLEAPCHFMHLLTPAFLKQPEACFINVTSGLAYSPSGFAPMYGATKSALHSYTVASRYAYATTNIRLVELIPPAVETALVVAGAFTVPLDEFCDAVFKRFQEGELEIGYKSSEMRRLATRETLDKMCMDVATMMKAPQFPSSKA